MSELRKEFESLPEVIDSLSCHIRISSDGLYYTSLVNFEKLTAWLNGAWFAFQEQQAKINELQKKINNVNEVLSKANIKDDRFSLEFALNEIEELLK